MHIAWSRQSRAGRGTPTNSAKASFGVARRKTAPFLAQDAARGFMNQHLYEPKTTPSRFVCRNDLRIRCAWGLPSRGTRLAEGAGRRIASYAGDLTRNAVVPGAVSETGGQLTEGTPFEPIARAAGAIADNGRPCRGCTGAVLRSALGDPNAIDWDRATQRQSNSTDIRLTGPEANEQAQNGGALPNVRRPRIRNPNILKVASYRACPSPKGEISTQLPYRSSCGRHWAVA